MERVLMQLKSLLQLEWRKYFVYGFKFVSDEFYCRNIANSFVSGYPGTGALSRGAVNNASGVRTPFGSLYTGKFFIIKSILKIDY